MVRLWEGPKKVSSTNAWRHCVAHLRQLAVSRKFGVERVADQRIWPPQAEEMFHAWWIDVCLLAVFVMGGGGHGLF